MGINLEEGGEAAPPFPSSQSPLVLLIYINSDPLLFNSANSLKRFGLKVLSSEIDPAEIKLIR
jgi:hypothetical protein